MSRSSEEDSLGRSEFCSVVVARKQVRIGIHGQCDCAVAKAGLHRFGRQTEAAMTAQRLDWFLMERGFRITGEVRVAA